MLAVADLAVKYAGSEQFVLQEISFQLSSKSILGIFGRSGSGKTTLLKTVAGLISPSRGYVSLNEEQIEGPADKLVPGHEEIRLVFQDFKLKHKMTVAENILYELLPYEQDYRSDRLERMLHICLLADFRDTYVEELSGGQKQRVAVARALATEPQLLLMDEPFSNLDIAAKSLLRSALHNIVSDTNSAVVFVSHDPAEVLALCDQVLVIDEGKILQKGTPQAIYQRPTSHQVAALFSRLCEVQKDRKAHYYRPENIVIANESEADFEGVVQRVDYLGSYQLLFIKSSKGETLLTSDHQFLHQKGEKVFLKTSGNPAYIKEL